MKLNWKLYITVLTIIFLGTLYIDSQSEENSHIIHMEKSAAAQPVNTVVKPPIQAPLEAPQGIVPATIKIPAINVEADLEAVGILENGEMGVPEDPMKAGWFEPGVKPGSNGNAVIAGHVDSKIGPAVFYNLDQLVPGDEIIIRSSTGETRTFVVEKLISYPEEQAPIRQIFGSASKPQLNLITCTGEFIRDQGGHQDRLVVYTKLVK